MHGTGTGESAATFADPRHMTRAQLRQLGLPLVGYLRCGTIEGRTAYALHAADGTAVAIVDDLDCAWELAAEHDLTLVAVH